MLLAALLGRWLQRWRAAGSMKDEIRPCRPVQAEARQSCCCQPWVATPRIGPFRRAPGRPHTALLGVPFALWFLAHALQWVLPPCVFGCKEAMLTLMQVGHSQVGGPDNFGESSASSVGESRRHDPKFGRKRDHPISTAQHSHHN